MSIFSKKENEAEKLFREHFDMVGQTVYELKRSIDNYLQSCDKFKECSFNVHKMEHDADLWKHKIELKLYEGAFLPIYRGDYLELVERIDKIANRCEDVADFLSLTRPTTPEWLHEGVQQMMVLTVGTYEELKLGFDIFMEGMHDVFGVSQKVGDKEQAVDKVEWESNRAVFKSDLELAHKLLLREFIGQIGKISNRMEDVADYFEIIATKRRF